VAGALLASAPAKGYRSSTVREARHGSRRLCATRPSTLATLRRQPTTRDGGKCGGVHRALSIIAKSSPDGHLRIAPMHPSSEPVDRPELVRATVRPVAAAG
jgi:hypothetical protein